VNTGNADPSRSATIGLEPFVSELARTWHREMPELSEREVAGTLVFADISGFTRLTERLAAKGRIGAEEISDHLDLVLSELLTAAYDRGGWLVKWGGDALLLMYDGEDHASRATTASSEMQARVRRVGLINSSVGRVRLRMSVGIHTGTFTFHFLGHRHRELLITGDAASITAKLEATAEAGEILLSPATARLLPAECIGAPKGDGVLLARSPGYDGGSHAQSPPPGDVSGLVPELVYEHLLSGGGSGEHRPVAIAFLEFSGMAAVRAEHGAAAPGAGLRHLVEVTQEACRRNTVSFHETDISADGGKIMLVGGAPRGLEDPAEAMLCTVRQVFDEPGTLSIRAGVTAGRAFTGAVGPAMRRSYSVKGDVVNLAARVMGKTPPGQIWALPVVVESSRTQFELGDVPRFMVKGKAAPILVRSVGQPIARVEASPDLPMIGRTSELTSLQRALDDAKAGRGHHVDLVGPPGIGKTRLVAELKEAAYDVTVLSCAAELYRAAAPYSLVRPLLLRALGAEDVDPAGLVGWLDSWSAAHAPDLSERLPLLGPVLGVLIDETATTRDLAPQFRADQTRELVLEILAVVLREPTLLVVDDMQFADEASEALLRHVAANVADRPWLVVLVGRDAPPSESPPGTSPTLRLGPLNDEEALVLTCADTDDSPLPPHVADAVVARGDGNPLFLRQLAVAAHTVADTADLPDSVESVVATRIDRLRPAARDVLRAVSVGGMSIEQDLLGDLLTDAATKPDAVLGELGEFLMTDGDALRFRQVVIRDTAYSGLAYRRRAELHGRMATLLTDRYGDDSAEIGAVLSLHLLHAGVNDRALRIARRAADRAAEAYTNSEAAALYRRALTAAERLASVEPTDRAELYERLGDIQVRLGEYVDSDLSYTAATRLMRGDPLAVARAGLKRGRTADLRGSYALALGRLRRATAALDAADAADGQAAADLRLDIKFCVAFVLFRQGRFEAARRACAEVIEHGDPVRQAEVIADALAILDISETNLGVNDDGTQARRALELRQECGDLGGQARVLTQIGYRAYFEGRWDDAVTAYISARELVERLGDMPNVALTNANIAEILVDQDRLAEAETALREAIRVWRASGSENEIAFARTLLGRVFARQGRYDEAETLLSQSRARFEEQGAKTEVVDADTYLAECLALRGRPEQALLLAEQTLVAAGRLSEHPVQAPRLRRVIGACHDALGDSSSADSSYAEALDLARRRGADHEVVFTVAAMTRRAGAGGQAVDAELLREVAPLLPRLGLVLDLTGSEAAAAIALPKQRAESPAMPVSASRADPSPR
jgi:class 3 adenylate cyclase/tetratricopeptide (TPR) repeat protein